jgi:energy-coupling factor transporter ATP-binding protein EcfA2
MLITKFVTPSDEVADIGLKAINMDRLGKFVALTGKNGAGKSRILSKLNNYIVKRNQAFPGIDRVRESIVNYKNAIQTHPPEHSSQVAWRNELIKFEQQVILATERVFSASSIFGVLPFVPKQLNLADAKNFNKNQLQHHAENAKKPGLGAFESSCFAYIEKTQERDWNASHQHAQLEQTVIDEAKESYIKLVSLIEKLLKTNLGRSIDGDSTLFNKPLAQANLSDGQKVLIQLAVALHAQNGKLDDTVFLLDEPENHLHPSALIEFLDTLEAVAPNAQFWIATHSVPLLAHIAHKEPMSIWYVEDGAISNAGSKPEKVLHGLLGNDAQIANLSNFSSLPAQYAALTFAAESLFPPKTVGGGKGDPQVAQIGEMLSFDESEPIAVLDYGAGKSRLLSGLDSLAKEQGKELKNCLYYYAFDTSDADKPHSEAAISAVYGNNADKQHFLNEDGYFASKDNGAIDVVVMCNVLHEISAHEWLKLFGDQSLINRALKDNGTLLIVEDQRIPTGEKAHEFGFLVFDTAHLKTLFSIKETDISAGLFRTQDHRGDGRLKAHWIGKALLGRITSDTRKQAIEELIATAKVQINQLRKAAPDYKVGQLHGFWTQQLANAILVHETL